MDNLQDNVLGETNEIPANMEVISSVLEPIILTETHARWVLRNEGILSRDSCIQFQIALNNADQDKQAFLPCGAGIWSLINSATLSVGGKRVNHTEGCGYWKSMTSSYDTPSYRNNKKRILEGVQTVLEPTAIAPSMNAGGMFSFASSNVETETTPGNLGIVNLDYQSSLRYDENLTPCFTIKLADLFNILWDVEMPLFKLASNQEVSIDLRLNQQIGGDNSNGKGNGVLCCFQPTGVLPANQQSGACHLVKSSCILYQDTLYYSDERMEIEAEKVNAAKGEYLSYCDVIGNIASHPQNSQAAPLTTTAMTINQKTDLIPLSGFRAKNLFWAETVNDYTSSKGTTHEIPPANQPTYYNSLLGVYALLAYHDNNTWDLRVNDVLSYPTPITSQSVKATEAENCYGSPVWLNQALWSWNPNTDKDNDHQENPRSKLLPDRGDYPIWGNNETPGFLALDALTGAQSFAAVNLSHGWGNDNDDFVLIGQKPIEVQHTMPVNSISNYNRTCRYYSEVVKQFGIKGGKVDIMQGPAVVY